MRPAASAAAAPDPAGIQAVIERFLAACQKPSLLEPGEEMFALEAGNWALHRRESRLTLEVWDETRNLARRITGVAEERRGRLELIVEKFARKEGRLWLLDTARPQAASLEQRGGRLVFRERLRLLLARQFPGWEVGAISTEPDLAHTLSPSYPRALLKKGRRAMAAIAAPPGCADPDGALAFGLIWLDYARRRRLVERLLVILPQGAEATTCHRVRWLDCGCDVYSLGEDDLLIKVDPRDSGNLATRLDPVRQIPAEALAWVERIAALPGVERIDLPGGSASLRVLGLEFARTAGGELLFGMGRRAAAREHHAREIEQLAREIAAMRQP
ncbi:MAG: hypothetical protein ACRD96_10105, partial [Bryobacteraceae bacterium]